MNIFNRVANWFSPALPAKHIEIEPPSTEEAIHAFIVREACLHGFVAYEVTEDGSLTRIDTNKDDAE